MTRNVSIELFFFIFIPFALFLFGAVPYFVFLGLAAFSFLLVCFHPDAVFDLFQFPRWMVFLFCFLFAWLSIQTFFVAADRASSIYQLIKWLSAVALFALAQKMQRDSILRVLSLVVLIGVIESCYGLFQVESHAEQILFLQKTDHVGYITGTFTNRNHFAGFLELVIGVHLGFILRAFSKKKFTAVMILIIVLFFFMFALVRSGSRMGMFSLFLSLVLFAMLIWQRSSLKGAVLFVLFGLASVVGLYLGWDIVQIRVGSLVADMGSLEGRLTGWQDAVRMLSAYFWKGCGLGNFEFVFPLFQSADNIYGWKHAHQDYLELLIEIGIIGFMTLLILFTSIFMTILKSLKTKEFSSVAIVFGIMTGCASLLIHGFLDFNFAIPANGFLWIILLGFAYRLMQFEKRKLVMKRTHG